MSQNNGKLPQINSTVSFSLDDVTLSTVLHEANESLRDYGPSTADENERFIDGCDSAFMKHAGDYGVAVIAAIDNLAAAMEASGIDEKTRLSLISAVEGAYCAECIEEKRLLRRMAHEAGYREGVADHALVIVKATRVDAVRGE